jgi:hypothetical protein
MCKDETYDGIKVEDIYLTLYRRVTVFRVVSVLRVQGVKRVG